MNKLLRLRQTLTRKRSPILGRILDQLNTVPLSLLFFCLLIFVLWKFYIVYLLPTFLLNYDMSVSSTQFDYLKASAKESAGIYPTIGRTRFSSSVLSSLFGITDSYSETAVSGQVDQKGEKNDELEIHLPTIHNQDYDRHTLDQSIKEGESSSYLYQGDAPVQPAVLPSIGASKRVGDTPLRVLHIVTALTDINSGLRDTIRGQDRLQEMMIPVLVDSVSTMISAPYHYQVDVYLVLGWKLKAERRRLIEDALPEGVGLEIWDDASPLGYDKTRNDDIQAVTRSLARQHRFVIKDKIDHYDFFSVFEDDMRVTGGHISHYLEVTAELNRLKDEAPDTLPDEPRGDLRENFYGPLSKLHLGRMIPGFIRVEVLLDESKSQEKLDTIPVDLDFDVQKEDGTITTERRTVDPVPCCSISNVDKLPEHPTHDQIMLWETAVFGANVRKLPTPVTPLKSNMLDWVLLQTGPKADHMRPEQFIGGYWSGRDGAYGDAPKLGEAHPKFIAQQGGWMATREQLIDMHKNQCKQGFFPPFDQPGFHEDGLLFENVEFWSGAFQIFVGFNRGCNMQRVISMHPDHFSKHLLYHTANNKQDQGSIQKDRKVKADHFLGQVNSVVKAARSKMEQSTGNKD